MGNLLPHSHWDTSSLVLEALKIYADAIEEAYENGRPMNQIPPIMRKAADDIRELAKPGEHNHDGCSCPHCGINFPTRPFNRRSMCRACGNPLYVEEDNEV